MDRRAHAWMEGRYFNSSCQSPSAWDNKEESKEEQPLRDQGDQHKEGVTKEDETKLQGLYTFSKLEL